MPARKKVVSFKARELRVRMVRNLKVLIERAHPGLPLSTAYKNIEKDTGVSDSTLQRIMSGDIGPSIDTLADLAHNLGCTIPELFSDELPPALRPPNISPAPSKPPPPNSVLRR